MYSQLFSFLLVSLLTCASLGAEDPWVPVERLESMLRLHEAELRHTDDVLDLLRQIESADGSPEVTAARLALAEAERGLAKAHTEAGLDEPRDKLREAQFARDAAATRLLTASPPGRKLVDEHAAMLKRMESLEGRLADLSQEELRELAVLRRDTQQSTRRLYDLRRSLWERAEVVEHYRVADRAYKDYGRKRKSAKSLAAAEKQVKTARQNLDEALASVPLKSPFANLMLSRRAKLIEHRKRLDAEARDIRRSMFEGAKTVEVMVEMPPKRDKPQKPQKVSLWIPPDCEEIRGVVIASGQVKDFATGDRLRAAAMQADLATMYMPHMSFDGSVSWERLDELLPRLAAASEHPELIGAPILTAGLSASVLATRNFAYERPDRMIGTVQIAGGNMHHKIMDASQSLSGVPFLAINGELEWCGPEGGIRPEYGRQTQWLMLREQLLRRRRADPNHLMSMVVVPGGDHGHWDRDLAALFVVKAAQYRIPKVRADRSKPVKCIPLTAKDGWLTDADLDHPKHDPAPFDRYTGDKTEAFWHFDEEMARAVFDYHADRFILADPTKASPVPSDWPK